jgi:hypothetical protein
VIHNSPTDVSAHGLKYSSFMYHASVHQWYCKQHGMETLTTTDYCPRPQTYTTYKLETPWKLAGMVVVALCMLTSAKRKHEVDLCYYRIIPCPSPLETNYDSKQIAKFLIITNQLIRIIRHYTLLYYIMFSRHTSRQMKMHRTIRRYIQCLICVFCWLVINTKMTHFIENAGC